MQDSRERILQANLNNLGGAFSVAYEAQKSLQDRYIFDYYFPDSFVRNAVYDHLISMGSRCIGEIKEGNRFFKQYTIYKNLYRYLCDNHYNVVHIHADTAWKIAVYYLAARRAHVNRIIVHSHSSGINGHYHQLNYALHLLAKPIVKGAQYRCACSDIAAKWMFDTTDNVRIIRNGVDIEKFSFNKNARTEIRNKYRINDNIVIGSASDFSPQKNPSFMYQVVKAFQENPRYTFLFVGNRPDGCELKQIIDADDSIDNVTFTGSVTNVSDYLSAMDVFILPSRFEGLPMCALEAQVNGLHTLVSDRVTEETKCSNRFHRLPLSVKIWKEEIEYLDITADRNTRASFLDDEKASSSNMADAFERLYTE